MNNSNNENFEELLFWGKIEGLSGNYYIAQGINFSGKYEFPEKSFFWCSTQNNFAFMPFEALNDYHRADIETYKQFFWGEAAKVLKSVEPPKAEGGEEAEAAAAAEEAKKKEEEEKAIAEVDPYATEESEKEPVAPLKNFTELDRLHYTVRAIENDCHVIPHGSFKLTTRHEVRRNEAFTGLPKDKAFCISQWSHFRNVQCQEKKAQIEQESAIYKVDFLDEACCDQPKGQWSVQKDSTKTVACVRNLQWPGHFAWHKVGSGVHGNCYVGDGLKNGDLAFML